MLSLLQKTSRPQESNHCNHKNASYLIIPHVEIWRKLKNCIIVIKNIPCLECEQCGEKYYMDEIAEKLEMIVGTAKKWMQEMAVIDYWQVA